MDFRIITLPLAALLALAIYTWFLQPLNAYMGMVPIQIDFGWIVLFIVWTMLAATVLPRRIERPSDLFLFFYVIITFLWGSTLWGVTGLLSLPGAALLMLSLYLPALVIRTTARTLAPAVSDYILPVRLFARSGVYLPLIALLAIGAIAAFLSLGSGSFGLDNVYDRRLAGREALDGHILAAYLIPMSINGAAPLLAFIAGWRRSPVLVAAAAAAALLMFWLLGLKSPFINIAALFGIGLALGIPRLRRQIVPLGMGCLIVMLAGVAWTVLDGSYSALGDYVLRRVVMVQPEVQSYYIHYFLGVDVRQVFLGVDLAGYSDWTFLIGDTYLHNPATNADTNGFTHALLRGGLLGYVFAVVAVSALLMVIDILFEHTGMPEFIGISGLYGVLVSEQSYTAALLTSGIGLCLVLITLFSYPSSGNKKFAT
jgi:hypothetical protein